MNEKDLTSSFPDPDILQSYENIVPGSAKQILEQIPIEAKRIQLLDEKLLFYMHIQRLLGMVFGFIIGMTAVISGAFVAYSGAELSGSVIGGAGTVGLVAVFIYGAQGKGQPREMQSDKSTS